MTLDREISVRQETGAQGSRHPSVDDLGAIDGWLCAYCGDGVLRWRGGWSRDHIVPQSSDGDWNVRNLVLACQTCNSRRGPRELYEWYDRLRDRGELWMHPYLLSVIVDVALASDLELGHTRTATADGPVMLREALDGLLTVLEDYYETGKPTGYLG